MIWRRRQGYSIPMLNPRLPAARFAASKRRHVLEKASGDQQFSVEQTGFDFEEIEGEIVARTHEIARWRETGEIAYERDFELRLTVDDERVVRIVLLPGARLRASRRTPSMAGAATRPSSSSAGRRIAVASRLLRSRPHLRGSPRRRPGRDPQRDHVVGSNADLPRCRTSARLQGPAPSRRAT